MGRLFFILSLFIIHNSAEAQVNYPRNYFAPPLNIPLALSGTFGELRSNHFHSGIDLKTGGREGLPVLASAAGEVSRIKVSPYGFGYALYLRHPNGYTTVYAHLQKFSDEIAQYVRQEQYRLKSFEVDLYPPGGMFVVEKGEQIALSGNSGGSGGPHLHFEIRDSRTEKIINPLLFGFDIRDSRHPELNDLLVYEFADDDMISSQSFRLINNGGGEYFLTGDGVVEVNGDVAFALNTYDRQDAANNRNGVYRIQLWVDDRPYYDFRMETFAFDESRYINSHIDFAQKICCGRVFNRLYLEPGNELSVYGNSKKLNFPGLQTDSLHKVKIEVRDVAGNTSSLQFKIRRGMEALMPDQDVPDLPVLRYNQPNFFKKEKLEMNIPQGAFYNDVYFEYRENKACAECLSPIYSLGAREIPVHKYYSLKIKPSANYTGDPAKLAIGSFVNGRLKDFEGGTWEGGYVVAKTRQLGDFAVVADTIAPLITPVNFGEGRNVKTYPNLKIRISDNFSGIDSYYPEIDGKWVLMEYDAKADLLILKKEDMNLSPGSHTFNITVTDKLGNKTLKTYHLIF